MALDILHDNWGPYTHTEVENALKAYLSVLEDRINQAIQEGGVGMADLSAEVQAVLNKANTALQPENIAAWAKAQNKPGYTADEITGITGFQNLLAKLQDMDAKIQEAAASGGVDPDDEMSSTSEKPVQNKVIKAYVDAAVLTLQNALNALMNGQNVTDAIDTFNEVKAFLDGIDTDDPTLFNQLKSLSDAITALQNTLSQKANDSAVVKSISVNGTAQQKDQNGNVNIQVQAGEQVSVIQPNNPDGTFIIRVGETDYTINLNHTHENMAKLVVCEESDLPSTLAKDTIYAQVDDAADPTEIQSLWIAGLEFVGGGGAIDDTSRLITPRDGLTLDFDGQSTIQLPVRGKNLLADLSLTVTGDFTVTDGNGTTVSTIAATAANDGVVLRLTKGSNLYSGTLRIFSSEVDVTVTLEKDSLLPAGYSPLEAVSVNSKILSLANTHIPIYSSWRLVLRSSSSSSGAQVAICQNDSHAGRYFGVVASGKWGVAVAAAIDGLSVTAKTEALVEFSASLSKLTIGDKVTTITPSAFDVLESNETIELFGCSSGDPYYFRGYVYEIECVSGGSFHALPAKRLSDNAVGLYDIENDVFYTGFSS